MSQYVIKGGKRLEGELQIDGCKNAVLPIIAATLLIEDVTYIQNCPKILDVRIMTQILEQLGCHIQWQEHTLAIDTRHLTTFVLNESLVKKMRSSIILLGALMGRCKEAQICQPGGCQLGARPIDLHLEALKKMNVAISEKDEMIYCQTQHLQGATINLKFPSVGATENIMLAAVKSEGITVIHNAAREPEIVDLQDFLVKCGAKIVGAGTKTIMIQGVSKLSGTHYQVIPDRIIAGTYLVAAAITRGQIVLDAICPTHLKALTEKLIQMGCKIDEEQERIILSCPNELKGVNIITEPYPGFPTDMQSQMMALLCTCNQPSFIRENLFESRFKIVEELRKMGADIRVKDCTAYIGGYRPLYGKTLYAKDLRGGAALILAGLVAEGTTVVEHVEHVERGYQNIVSDLSKLGANIQERK